MNQRTDLPILDQTASRTGPGGTSGRATSLRPFLPSTPTPPPRALYIHVPFCFHKCHYCDFYSIVDTRDRQESFVARLVRELDALAPLAGPLDTIFVGGGTPSLLRVELWQRLLPAIHGAFDTGSIRAGRGEFTVECNPETVTPELLGVLRDGGVDRLSLGAQSFDPRHLKTLERWHDPASVPRAVALARSAGFARLSVDLIYAIPGQTLGDVASDLRAALGLGTEHVSCYSLTYEPNTAMTARLRRGEFAPCDEDLEVEMFHLIGRTLGDAGLERYEVSNFARHGAECRHNLVYWRDQPWLAAGPSASGHLVGPAGRVRWKNAPRLDDYLAFDDAGLAPVVDVETPDASRAFTERLMMGLRLREGLDRDDVMRSAGAIDPSSPARLASAGERCRRAGWLADDPARLRVTPEGFLFVDAIVKELVGAVGPVARPARA